MFYFINKTINVLCFLLNDNFPFFRGWLMVTPCPIAPNSRLGEGE